ncbi:MAG TPA: acyl-CoA synthetase [Beijerinckiaceae bacterium]|jgi:acetyl-CoA synthetase|nr:acyl-CoA synthetase [Beijerinckiaceae bacterium]
MLPDIHGYDRLIREFRWQIPARYNIGVDVCDRWAKRVPNQAAILEVNARGDVTPITYADLRQRSNRLASALAARGVKRGDRVAVLLPQVHQTAVAHIAIYKIGAIAVPLAALFGVDALEYRLRDAGVKAIVTNGVGATKLAGIRGALPELQSVLCTDGASGGAEDYNAALAGASTDFTPADTSADDPGLMIYTSGTTGPAKGALHGHRVVLGHMPGVEFPHEFFPQPGDRFWTPADWAWAGGLLNSLLPSLHFGIPIVARSFEKFDPEAAFALMADLKVRNTFIPPTALRMLRAIENPRGRFDLNLRTLASGGESLGAETYAWGREQLGLTINEFYGQTECNLVLGSCAAIGIGKPGAIGRAIPGHNVAVIRDDGTPCELDELGQIAVKRPDPVMFIQYWNKPEATRDKFIGDWMTTGDQGMVDEDGYIRFIGRDDDVITSSGYRIGPGEIEDCLIRHPAVAIAAAVGKPDPVRTEIVKAFIVLKAGHAPSDALAADIQHFVRTRLAAHEYPREVAFVDSLPLTTTGKVIRRELRQRA